MLVIYCGMWMPINNGWITQTCNLQPAEVWRVLNWWVVMYHVSLFSTVAIWNVFTINGGFYDKSTKYYLETSLGFIYQAMSFEYKSNVQTMWNIVEPWENSWQFWVRNQFSHNLCHCHFGKWNMLRLALYFRISYFVVSWMNQLRWMPNGTHLEFQHFQRSRLPGLPCASISAIAKTNIGCPGMDPKYNGCASQLLGW